MKLAFSKTFKSEGSIYLNLNKPNDYAIVNNVYIYQTQGP